MNVSLSDGEWKLMNRLWEHAPRTITELTAALREETGWSKNTIITMLSRLEAKGAVAQAAQEETESFLSKVYGGSLGSLVNAMVSSRALTEADLEELSAILEQAKEAKDR